MANKINVEKFKRELEEELANVFTNLKRQRRFQNASDKEIKDYASYLIVKKSMKQAMRLH